MDDPGLLAYSTAKKVQSRFPTVAPIELIRDGHEWLQQHPKRLEKAREDDAAYFRLEKQLRGHIESQAVARIAKANGYEPHDVYFFNTDVISGVLPGLFDDGYVGITQEREEVHVKRDAAEGNNWPALLGDVGAAFKRCSDWTKVTLFDAYALRVEMPTAEVDEALREVRDQLGGARPQGCSRSCEECGDASEA